MALAEGEVGRGDENGIAYTAVSSCLTVTCLMDDGKHVGGHLSLVTKPGKFDSSLVLSAMASLFDGRSVIMIHIAGDLQSWNSAFLTVPQWDGEGEAATLNPAYSAATPYNDVSGEVSSQLGAPSVVPSTETKTGEFTIRLPQ